MSTSTPEEIYGVAIAPRLSRRTLAALVGMLATGLIALIITLGVNASTSTPVQSGAVAVNAPTRIVGQNFTRDPITHALLPIAASAAATDPVVPARDPVTHALLRPQASPQAVTETPAPRIRSNFGGS